MSKPKIQNVTMPEAPEQPHPSKELGGSVFPDFNHAIVNDAIRTFFIPEGEHAESWRETAIQTTLIALKGLGPKNELEGMLCAQLVAAHAASIECYRRAALSKQTFEARSMNLRYAAKATRSFALLIETLQKLRGEARRQAIHVHHHHTDARTQVAAGRATVNVGDVRERESVENGEQPHERAAIGFSPGDAVDVGPALRGEEPGGETLPMSGDAGHETLSPARRQEPRRA